MFCYVIDQTSTFGFTFNFIIFINWYAVKHFPTGGYTSGGGRRGLGDSKSALIWQKEASDKSDISRKTAKCVCHLHWRQWNIMMSYLTYLLVGWVFLHESWPGRRAHVNYENINNSNLDGMSLASFCQSSAELPPPPPHSNKIRFCFVVVLWFVFCLLLSNCGLHLPSCPPPPPPLHFC